MNSHIQNNFHGSQNPARHRGAKRPKQNGLFAVFAALAALLAIVSLSSCAGLTSAGKPGGGTLGTGMLTASATTLGFGNVSVGSNATQTLTLTNTGTATVNMSSASTSGAGFTSTGGSPLSAISVGQSGTIQIHFAPPSAGVVTGSLTIASDAGNSPLTISLTGTGTQQLAANPSSASFGNVVIGNHNSQTITLTNGATTSFTITQATATGTGFSTSGLSLPKTIAAGGSTTFNVVFSPTIAGSVNGSVSLISNAPNSPLVITLSGTGAAATALLRANPTSLPFGIVTLTSNSALATTLTNNGNTDITISSVTVTGAGFAPSGVSSGMTLMPNQTATLTISFAPTVAGAVNGNVSIASNATNSPATVSLSGTGAPLSPHTVALSWNASSSSGVVGYFVYRGTVSGGPYTKQNSSPDTSLAFTDSGLASGQTYFYVVTAMDGSNVESAFSNQASALLP